MFGPAFSIFRLVLFLLGRLFGKLAVVDRLTNSLQVIDFDQTRVGMVTTFFFRGGMKRTLNGLMNNRGMLKIE